MFQTYGLSHLQISVGDLERSGRFYKELFGMNEVRRFPECVMLQTPGAHEILTINASSEGKENVGKMGGVAHFGFRLIEPVEMSKIQKAITQLGGKPISEGGSIEKGRLYAIATDPDGYEVEVFWEP
jgi:catechol 2,3-dioxygenase-like lactoylglutathione lyase family enzyme